MTNEAPTSIAAVIAAAGFSRRMGRFKQLLPWGDRTVIESVVSNLVAAGADPVICVVGYRGDEVEHRLRDTGATVVDNPEYDRAEMLSSYQHGVQTLVGAADGGRAAGSLLALGDQPHITVRVICRIIEKAVHRPDRIVIPSHEMRRGHPIYLPRHLWSSLLALDDGKSLRDLIDQHNDDIEYVVVDTDAIYRDMDVWADYEALSDEYTE